MPEPLRVLFSFAGGQGHLNPMLPIATVLREAGHRVALAGQDDVLDRTNGFAPLFPDEPSRSEQSSQPSHPVQSEEPKQSDRTTGALIRPDLDHEFEVIGTHFVSRLGRRRAERIGRVIEAWKPQLLICDEMDFGAMVAAERDGMPYAVVEVIASGALTRAAHVTEPLDALRSAHGLGADPQLSMLSGDLVITPFPPSFRDPAFPVPATAVAIRPGNGTESGPESRPSADSSHPAVDWLLRGSEPSRIYVTLGTIFNTESGDLFTRILDGLRVLPARILATVGPNVDPASIPVRAGNIRIERFVPQDLVLGNVDLMVNHGGSGSVIGALTRGVPVIVFPLGADQELNARRVAMLGAGAVLDPMTSGTADIADAAQDALGSAEMRSAARRIRDEAGALPPASSLLAALETLARGARPSR